MLLVPVAARQSEGDHRLKRAWWRGVAMACALVAGMLAPAGCDLRPGGTATIFRVAGKRQINTAVLHPPGSDETRKSIRLKFTDDNTFQTNDHLPPGRYRLALRSEDGLYLATEVEVNPEQWFYNVPEITGAESGSRPVAPTTVSATVSAQGALPPQLVVLFVGPDVLVRRVVSGKGAVRVDAPGPGPWRVEIVAPGTPPRLWVKDGVIVPATGNVDLGSVVLK